MVKQDRIALAIVDAYYHFLKNLFTRRYFCSPQFFKPMFYDFPRLLSVDGTPLPLSLSLSQISIFLELGIGCYFYFSESVCKIVTEPPNSKPIEKSTLVKLSLKSTPVTQHHHWPACHVSAASFEKQQNRAIMAVESVRYHIWTCRGTFSSSMCMYKFMY